MKLKSRISLTFSILLMVITFSLGYFYLKQAISFQFEEMQNKLVGLAVATSKFIIAEEHDKLRLPKDMNSNYYIEVRNKFRAIVKEYPYIRYIYTMVKTENPNIYKFVIDSSIPKDEDGDGKISKIEDVTPIGEEYDASKAPELKKAYNGPIADKQIIVDKWGAFLSGYAPIYNSSGVVIAVLGLDVKADTIKQAQKKLTIYIILLCLGSVLIAVILSNLLSDSLTRPLMKLVNSANVIGGGDLTHKINIRRKDEIGILADTMNSMTGNLKDKLDKLNTINHCSSVLSSTLDLNQAMKISLNFIFEITKTRKGLILLVDKDEKNVNIALSQGIDNIKFVEEECFIEFTKFGLSVGNELVSMIKEKPRIFIQGEKEIDLDEKYSIIKNWLASTKCSLCIPLILKSNLRGFFLLETEMKDVDFLMTLINQVTLAIENARLYSEAITDGLTGLYIHRYFQIQLETEFRRVHRYDKTFSLLMLDIDHFKAFNDNFGHQVGDLVLKKVSWLIKNTVREVDIVCRYGGEEISIILPETTKENAFIAAEKIRLAIEKYRFPEGYKVTVSIGVAQADKDYPISKEILVKNADTALYQAKNSGRNKVVVSLDYNL